MALRCERGSLFFVKDSIISNIYHYHISWIIHPINSNADIGGERGTIEGGK